MINTRAPVNGLNPYDYGRFDKLSNLFLRTMIVVIKVNTSYQKKWHIKYIRIKVWIILWSYYDSYANTPFMCMHQKCMYYAHASSEFQHIINYDDDWHFWIFPVDYSPVPLLGWLWVARYICSLIRKIFRSLSAILINQKICNPTYFVIQSVPLFGQKCSAFLFSSWVHYI